MSKQTSSTPILCDTVAHSYDPASGSSPKDARAARSANALREALLRLLELKAFEQITVREICQEAGIHYATFFRHHATKEALLDHIAAHQIRHLVDLTLPIRTQASDQESIRALCVYVEEHRALWTALLNGGAGATMREEWLRQARIVAADQRPANSWLPLELGTICSVSLIAETISWWLEQEAGAFSSDEIAAILHRLVATSTLMPDAG